MEGKGDMSGDNFEITIRPDGFAIHAWIASPEMALRAALVFNAAVEACWNEDDAGSADAPAVPADDDPAPEAAQPRACAAPSAEQPASAPIWPPPARGGGATVMWAIKPGGLDDKVMGCLRRGVTDVTAIADELDMLTGPVGAAKKRLVDGGFWPPKTERGEP